MPKSRHYRRWITDHDLVSFYVTCDQTDLMILAKSDLSILAEDLAKVHHNTVIDYIRNNPEFEHSLSPLEVDTSAPPIIREMYEASQKANVGPMAAVAGAIAEYIGKDLLNSTSEVIVENGGDIFLQSPHKRTVAIYAGNSPLSKRIGITLPGSPSPKGICTSSGTFGHALSFGNADAALAIASSAALADAAATAIGNAVKTADDINTGIEIARSIPGIDGTIIIVGKNIGIWGDIKLTPLD